MTITVVHTRTYALMDAWAETLPHDCPPGCVKPHAHPGDECAAPGCKELLQRGESCYAVVELDRGPAGEPWVCWRHVHPDQGPFTVEAAQA